MEISIATVFLYYVFKAAVSYPTVLVCVYPSFFSNSSTFCLKSPCTMISPSLALPPTPHLLLRNLPSSFKSSSVPINPVTRVTTLPPRFLRSNCTSRRCWDGWRVVCSSSSSNSYLKSGLVDYTTFSLSFQSFSFGFLAIYTCFNFLTKGVQKYGFTRNFAITGRNNVNLLS